MEVKNLNLSKREEVLLGFLLLVGVFSLYLVFLFLPKLQQINNHRQYIKEKEFQYNQMKQLHNGKELKSELEDVKEKWLKAKEEIPSSMKLPELYMNLLDIQKDSQVSFHLIEFASLEKASEKVYENNISLSKVDINVTLTGSYEQVDSFLQSLYSNKRKLEVTRVHYENREGEVYANMGLVAFALLKENDSEWTQYDFIQGKSYGKSNPFDEGEKEAIDNSIKVSNNKD